MTEKNGIALVLVAGLLAMLGFLAVAFSAGVDAARSGRASLACGAAGRVAESGLEYASARLRAEASCPRPRTLTHRVDDWMFRDSPGTGSWGPRTSSNPSYCHGEPWIDDGNGIYESGEPFTDQDGDGRFSAWSGRLRGGKSPFADRFSLKIGSAGGKIPVNRFTRNGNLIKKDSFRSLLDNLGSRVLPVGHPRRASLATSNPNRAIETSRLGSDIVAFAPEAGIPDAATLAATLLDAGWRSGPDGAPWGLAEILPHVTFAPPPELSPQFRLISPGDISGNDAVAVPSIDLATATAPVLESVWLYATHPPATGSWRSEAAGAADPDSGRQFLVSNLILYPEDAAEAAGAILAYRDACLATGAPLRVSEIRRVLLENAPTLFPAPASLATFPEEAARWSQSQADLAFFCLTPDAPPHFATAPATLHTGGLFPPRVPDLDWLLVRRTEIPAGPAYPNPAAPFTDAGVVPGSLALLTARPPLLFEIASAAVRKSGPATSRAERSGILETGSPLFLGSQQDLENVPASDLSAALSRAGIDPDSIAGSGRLPATNGGRTYRQLASLPSWDWRSYPPEGSAGFTGYSPFFGALTLAGLEAGPQVAQFYWPFGEALGGMAQTFRSETGSSPPVLQISWAGQRSTDPPTTFRPLDPAAGFLHTRAQPLFTPHQVTGNGDLSPSLGNLPDGLLSSINNPGGPLSYAAFEFWATPCPPPGAGRQVVFGIRGFNRNSMGGEIPMGEYTIEIEGLAAGPSGGPPELVFHCHGIWGTPGGSAPLNLRIPFADEAARVHPHFCRMEIKPNRVTNTTTIALWVNDQTASSTLPRIPLMPQIARICVTGVDEFRIYTTPAPDGSYDITRRPGRFTRSGSYVSPCYTFSGGPRLIRHVQWNGHVPPGFPAQAIRASIDMYGGVRPLEDAGNISNFSSAEPTSFFQYRVDFNATSAAEPLLDTPVFESVELVLGLPKGASGWLRYE